MSNIFNSVKYQKQKRNFFDLTHDVKLSFNMGDLIPIMCMEAIPGDKININCQSLIRFAPLIAPVMHRMDVYFHYFFVPYRLLWDNWENYITGTPDPNTGLPYVFPTGDFGDSSTYWTEGCLADYLGIPDISTGSGIVNYHLNAMPFAAYQKIYDEYYRDQNLIAPVFQKLTDGNTNLLDLTHELSKKRKRAWEHDYFTASLPFAQKGAAVSIPLGDVELKSDTGLYQQIRKVSDHSFFGTLPSALETFDLGGGESVLGAGTLPSGVVLDPNGTLTVGSTTINDLRRAYRLQEWLEKNARGGTRYIENILAHFGVHSSDKRLQRPEYIVGSKSPVIISEIVNTGGDAGTIPQGNLAGHGLTAVSGKMGSYYCEEHGLVMGILSMRPKTAYQDGMPKLFLKTNDQFDFFWPSFAHLGEQPVNNAEIFAWDAGNAGVFGYVPRYAEYKYMPSRVAGDFRNNLSFWHFGRRFSSPPALNQTFIECVPRSDTFAVEDPSTDKIYAHVLNQVKANRLMPKFGTPHT